MLVQDKISKTQDKDLTIVIGDFNHTIDLVLNKLLQTESSRKLALYKWLKEYNFVDIYRLLNPHKKKFTWSNNTVTTRID